MVEVWRQALRVLEQQLPAKDYAAWIVPMRPSGLTGGTATLEVPNGFFRDWVRRYFMAQLTEALTTSSGEACRVSLVVNPELGPPVAQPLGVEDASRRNAAAPARVVGRLVPEYTLDRFVVGVANELAVRGAVTITEEPSRTYNPLFVYGGVGVGKTHLLNAVGHAVLERHKRARVGCLTAENFVNAMIGALKRDRMDVFRARFRRTDVLIIDDVQFLGGKVRSQEEFFHTFNALREGGKQIVLASDRPPEDIGDLEECLRSRFGSGLLAPIAVPDETLRAHLVARKAVALGLTLSAEIIDMIAGSVQGNVRQLEGVVNAIRARCEVGARPVTRAVVREALSGLGSRTAAGRTVPAILDGVAGEFSVSVAEITSPRRTARIVEARQAAILLCRELTELSLEAIGVRMGGRDHSTVVYALDRATVRREREAGFRERVDRVMRRMGG
jgi:chromosomal replication initiator protein